MIRSQHRRGHDSGSARGFGIVELAIGIVVIAVGAVALVNHLAMFHRSTAGQQDRLFAYQKAQTILSEVQSYVDRGAVTAAVGLDALDDGVVNKSTLTITTQNGSLVAPDHAASGNVKLNGDWLWWRRISVRPFAGLDNRNVRYVTVRVYKRDRGGTDRLQATVSSVVTSLGSAFPTTQAFDVYLLAIENIPGWWVFMEAIVPFVESAITDIESRNPGLELRTHWITKASYGRNQVYRPYINEAVDSTQPVDRVYFYPGLMPAGEASQFYYVPDLIKGRVSVDGVERNGYDATTNPLPYALADFYNHAMRYPREKALHEQRIQAIQDRNAAIEAAKLAGTPAPPPLDDMSEEPTLRLFLEDLATDPAKYHNALIINLHGELLPMPSLRNVSDAAKAPEFLPGVRVVTHPEELRTARDPGGAGIDDVVLRVYAYTADPGKFKGSPWMPTQTPIAVQIMGMDLTDSTSPTGLCAGVEIENLRGGVTVDDDNTYGPFLPSRRRTEPGLAANEMYYDVEFVDPGPGEEKYTVIGLFHTPVVAPPISDSGVTRGLFNDKRSRLYNLEYVPSCTSAALDFSRDLFTAGAGPKNTARWTVRIPGTVFAQRRFVDVNNNRYDPAQDVTLAVRTRILDTNLPRSEQLETGRMWPTVNEPDNFSETYTWWADSKDDVPITERSQFQGDPRHNPYKDLWDGSPDFPNGYNWYFDALNNNGENSVADYPGIDGARLRNRWGRSLRQDVPRFFELFRNSLVNSASVYTTLTGFSYYYMGHGNEIGYDNANGYPNSIPCNDGPWSSSSSGSRYVQNITGRRAYVRNQGSDYWWGMPWLGELYPDDVYETQWIGLDSNGDVRGNLDAGGSSAEHFYRAADEGTYKNSKRLAYGTEMTSAIQRTSTSGSTSFFNIKSSAGSFQHLFSNGTGNLLAAGIDVATNFNYPVPSPAPINRPFSLTATTSYPDEFNYPPYSTNRYVAKIVNDFFDHSSGDRGSAIVGLTDPADTSSAFVAVNGISNTVASGSSFIAKWSLLTMVQTFFEGGNSSITHRIKMPPRVEIQSPTEVTELKNPPSVPVQFDTFWVRWDGLPFTTATPASFAEAESELEYVVMYSPDNGATWRQVEDDTLATPGERPADPTYLNPDTGPGAETVTWTTPSSKFVAGSYLVRVDAFRVGQQLHYSHHTVKIYIER